VKRPLCAILSAVLLGGCANVQLSSIGSLPDRDRLLVVQNDGYMLVGVLPLASGSLTWNAAEKEASITPVFFSNNTEIRHLYDVALRVAERENCELVNPTIIDNSAGLDPARLYGLITFNDVTLSAVLRPKK